MVENIILTVVQGASAVFLMLVVVVLKVFVGHIGEYCSTVNGSCVCSYTGATHTIKGIVLIISLICLLYTSPSPRDLSTSRMPSSA